MPLLDFVGLQKPIDPRSIICVIGDKNYAWLHCVRQQKHYLALTLKRIEERLPDFIRIHKASLINPAHIVQIDSLAPQRMSVELVNGMSLSVARRRIEVVRQQLNQVGIPMLKLTRQNIIAWWFAANTPIRQYKLSLSPGLQWACEQVSRDFTPPSGALTLETYRRADKVAFAKAVEELLETEVQPILNEA